MNEQLQIRVGEYLLSRDVHFSHVTSVDLDSDTGTLDIWYKNPEGVSEVLELHGIEDFLTFLVTGGK